MATKKNRKCIFKIGPKQCPLELPPLGPHDPSTEATHAQEHAKHRRGEGLESGSSDGPKSSAIPISYLAPSAPLRCRWGRSCGSAAR